MIQTLFKRVTFTSGHSAALAPKPGHIRFSSGLSSRRKKTSKREEEGKEERKKGEQEELKDEKIKKKEMEQQRSSIGNVSRFTGSYELKDCQQLQLQV